MSASLAPERRHKFVHGGQTIYEWNQTVEEVDVYIPLPPGIPARAFSCNLQTEHITVGIKGNPPYLDHALGGKIKVDSSFWTIGAGEYIGSNGQGRTTEGDAAAYQQLQDGATMEDAVKGILSAIGEEPDRDGLRKTPQRVASAFSFALKGLNEDPEAILKSALFPEEEPRTACGQGQGSGGMVVVRDVECFSTCCGCLLPLRLVCHVAYIPSNGCVVGLSKLPRAATAVARRLQSAGGFADQLCSAVESALRPRGAAVVAESCHLMGLEGTVTGGAALPGTPLPASAALPPSSRSDHPSTCQRLYSSHCRPHAGGHASSLEPPAWRQKPTETEGSSQFLACGGSGGKAKGPHSLPEGASVSAAASYDAAANGGYIGWARRGCEGHRTAIAVRGEFASPRAAEGGCSPLEEMWALLGLEDAARASLDPGEPAARRLALSHSLRCPFSVGNTWEWTGGFEPAACVGRTHCLRASGVGVGREAELYSVGTPEAGRFVSAEPEEATQNTFGTGGDQGVASESGRRPNGSTNARAPWAVAGEVEGSLAVVQSGVEVAALDLVRHCAARWWSVHASVAERGATGGAALAGHEYEWPAEAAVTAVALRYAVYLRSATAGLGVSAREILHQIREQSRPRERRGRDQAFAAARSVCTNGMHGFRGGEVDGVCSERGDAEGSLFVESAPFASLCEHHLLPFFGHVAVVSVQEGGPRGGVPSASGSNSHPDPAQGSAAAEAGGVGEEGTIGPLLQAAVQLFSRRLQVQERLTYQVAEGLKEVLGSDGLLVVMRAAHLCMAVRGVEKAAASTTTVATVGVLSSDTRLRARSLKMAMRWLDQLL